MVNLIRWCTYKAYIYLYSLSLSLSHSLFPPSFSHTHTHIHTHTESAVRALNFDDHETGPVDKKYTLYIQMGNSDDYIGLPSGSSLKQITDTVSKGHTLLKFS